VSAGGKRGPMGQAVRYQEILRRLAIVDEGFVGDQAAGATEDEITGVLLVIAPMIGLGRMAGAAPGVAGSFGYDIEAALDDPDEP
jgi:hypothetical protein